MANLSSPQLAECPPKLHDEIVAILEEAGRPMSTVEIAAMVNRRRRYRKRDGSEVTDFQIHGRTKNYPHLFEREGALVSLIHRG